MIEGPLSAPSSPPLTPTPRKRMPCPLNASARRSVSRWWALPPSRIVSPSSSRGTSCSITASVPSPALTMIITARGGSSLPTSSSSDAAPVIGPSSPKRSRNALVFSSVRLCTTISKPLRATLRARFAPMVARPVSPKLGICGRLPSMDAAERSARADAYESVRSEIVDLVPSGARRVLDLGCSTGWLAAALKARGDVEVVGIEREPEYAEAAREHCDRVVVADVESVPRDLGRFDCLVAADVLEHVVDPWTALGGYV